jgi:hypothetical protein
MKKVIRNFSSKENLDSRLRGNDTSKKTAILSILLCFAIVLTCGCDTLRFAPKEEQKQNAWLHWRVTELAAQEAAEENASVKTQGLTELSAQQSRAFVADYGMPKALPAAENTQQILAGSGAMIAQAAYRQSSERPDVWAMADGAIDLGIGLAGLLGGVYGIRAAQFLRQARDKSMALKEIIEGNELFKESNPLQASAFKEAQKEQSAQTRKIVTEMKV